MTPKKHTLLPLFLGLLVGGGTVCYGVVRWKAPAPVLSAALPGTPEEALGRAVSNRKPAPPASPASPASIETIGADRDDNQETGLASSHGGEGIKEGEKKDGEKGKEGEKKEGGEKGEHSGEHKEPVLIKMEPMVANLDEAEQLRYLKLSIQIEVVPEAAAKAQAQLARARHESLMYMSGLHLNDTQGLLAKKRIQMALQRVIADAIGGGLRRIYFDEFVVQ